MVGSRFEQALGTTQDRPKRDPALFSFVLLPNSGKKAYLALDIPATGRCIVASNAMVIHELTQQTGVSAKTIRYYESIGLLPRPIRAENNYRQYMPSDIERLKFIAGARSLGLSLGDVSELLASRENGNAPCQAVLESIAQRLNEIDRQLAGLFALRDSLRQLHSEGAVLPLDDVGGEHCICQLLKTYRDAGQVTIQNGEQSND